MGSKEKETLNPNDIYTEIGNNFRYFLSWRHALLAGYLAIIIFLIKSVVDNNKGNNIVLFLSGFFISIIFWLLDYRNRELYRKCYLAGAKLEKDFKFYKTGIYSQLKPEENKFKEENSLPHSVILNYLFGIISVAMVIGFLWSFWQLVK